MRRFHMVRHTDVSGFSGTGIVAEGVQFTDGRVAFRWCSPGKPSSNVAFDSLEDAVEVHGHDGSTGSTRPPPDRAGAGLPARHLAAPDAPAGSPRTGHPTRHRQQGEK